MRNRLQLNFKSSVQKGMCALMLLFFVSYTFSAYSQEDTADKEKWEFTIAPYLMFPNMSGDVTVGGKTVGIDAGTGDILENLKFGGMLYYEMSKNGWSIAVDALYMSLGKEGMMPVTERDAEVDMKEFAFETTVFNRVAPWIDLGIGGRIVSLESGVMVAAGNMLPGIDVSESKTWFDPIFAMRLIAPLEGKWNAAVRGDFGGFGIGSDFTWQVYPVVGYNFTKTFELALAYRALGINYKDGSGDRLFHYDVTTYGAELGFLFHF